VWWRGERSGLWTSETGDLMQGKCFVSSKKKVRNPSYSSVLICPRGIRLKDVKEIPKAERRWNLKY